MHINLYSYFWFLLIDVLYRTGMLHWDCFALQLQVGI